jgi:hypothetical protein
MVVRFQFMLWVQSFFFWAGEDKDGFGVTHILGVPSDVSITDLLDIFKDIKYDQHVKTKFQKNLKSESWHFGRAKIFKFIKLLRVDLNKPLSDDKKLHSYASRTECPYNYA